MTKSIVIVLMSFTFLLFQNCQKAAFAGGGEAISKSQGELVEVVSDDPEDLNDPDVVDDPVDPTDPEVVGEEPPEVVTLLDSEATGDYVCILAGPGKSVKLGMSTAGSLRGQNKIPQVLCMTREACLDIASRAFEVQGPELRGYCKSSGGNPHVSHITNGDLELKVQ